MSGVIFIFFNGKLNPRFWEQHGASVIHHLAPNEYVLFTNDIEKLKTAIRSENEVLGYEIIRDGRYDYLLKEKEL